MTKLIVTFCKFTNAPKKVKMQILIIILQGLKCTKNESEVVSKYTQAFLSVQDLFPRLNI